MPLAHVVNNALSREHLNVTPACESLNVNDAELDVVGFAGPVRIVGAGGFEAAPAEVTTYAATSAPTRAITDAAMMPRRPAALTRRIVVMSLSSSTQ